MSGRSVVGAGLAGGMGAWLGVRAQRRSSMTAVMLCFVFGTGWGCADMKDLWTLQRALSKEYHAQVGVHLNGDASGAWVLSLIVENSPEAQTPEQQVALARRIGEFVRDRYPGYRRLTKLSVGFSEPGGGGRFYTFTPQQLGAPGAAPPTVKPVKRVA